MVLDTGQVVAETVGKASCLEHADRVAGVGRKEVAELDWMSVVHLAPG